MKKLIPALVLLLVSAMVLSTSSYAWFSMNRNVTATGMSINATVPTQLLIKGSVEGAEFKSSINFNNPVDSVYSATNNINNVVPVAYKGNGESYTAKTVSSFYKLTTVGYALVKGNGYMQGFDKENSASDTPVTSSTFATLKDSEDNYLFAAATANAPGEGAHNDYVADHFKLKLSGTPSETVAKNQLSVTVTMTTPDVADVDASNIYTAVHVVLTSTSTKSGFTAALYDIDMGTDSTATTGSGFDTVTKTVILDSFSEQNEEITYHMYVYYDGEDSNCLNTNAVNMGAYTFTLAFSLPTE